MDQETLKNLLHTLLAHSVETEWIEFKEASQSMALEDVGKYFSALSNEANLKNKDRAWLVLGVSDAKQVTGTTFKSSLNSLNELKRSIAASAAGSSFIEIHEFIDPDAKRVLLFEIAPSPQGVLTKWRGTAFGREGEALVTLSDVKQSIIVSQDQNDWSGRKCISARIDDLDPELIELLKIKLAEATQDDQYTQLSTDELLRRLALLIDDVPVNAAILLLGKSESITRLMPEKAKITWRYVDEENSIGERLTFEAPILNKLEDILTAVNRFNVYLKEASLFRKDIQQYDELALRELLVNALAHRDWTIDLWIEIKQTPSQISFVNPGIFRADIVAAIQHNDRPPYLNKKLADILQRINLMEREGGGLRKVYRSQLRKGTGVNFNFRRSANPTVEFTLVGKVDDPEFARLILSSEDIELEDLLLLDQIRSGKNKVSADISQDRINGLKSKGYIETRGGRSQRAFISASLAQAVGKEPEYTTAKSLPRDAKVSIIVGHVNKFGRISVAQARKIFSNDPPSTVRSFLAQLAEEDVLERVTPSSNRAHWYYKKGPNA